MREILFRGKQTDKDKWIYGVPVKSTSVDESEILIIESVFECGEYVCIGCEFTPVIPSTVGQYTGLKDKNGRRIFEGDIVKGDREYFTYTHPYGRIVFENAISALEKQIPKKYLLVDGECICPACKSHKRSLDYYCDNCGQAIDWSDEE